MNLDIMDREQIIPHTEEEIKRKQRRRTIFWKGLVGLGVGAILGLIIPFCLEGVLHLLGFGAKGIVPGSIAAEWEAGMGNITKGSFFACKYFLAKKKLSVLSKNF